MPDNPLDLLFGDGERPRRGPKPSLTLDRVVDAAVTVADAEGLPALSMARVAEALGFTTMSLYRYVSSKDDLLVLMLDAAIGPAPVLTGDTWRHQLAHWCREQLALFQRHPWAVDVPTSGPPATPRQLDWMECALGAMEPTGLHPAEQVGVVMLLSSYVRSQAQLAADLDAGAAAASSGGAVPPTYGEVLRTYASRERYPRLRAVVDTGIFDQPGEYGEEDFEYGLGLVLDGVAALVAARRGDG